MKNYTYESKKNGLVGVDYHGAAAKMFDDVKITEGRPHLQKINKRQFEKLFYAGCSGLFIQPNKMAPINPWQEALNVDLSDLENNDLSLDHYLNNYRYYNCDAERGHGIAYYVDTNNKLAAMDVKIAKTKFYL